MVDHTVVACFQATTPYFARRKSCIWIDDDDLLNNREWLGWFGRQLIGVNGVEAEAPQFLRDISTGRMIASKKISKTDEQ